mmetsp:Transcript_12239/g.38781  ORF Transcript_12239/g.38781 Transcript_12239/m.38781 type:complete len:265 (-) Transcript_12239:86-880(-)
MSSIRNVYGLSGGMNRTEGEFTETTTSSLGLVSRRGVMLTGWFASHPRTHTASHATLPVLAFRMAYVKQLMGNDGDTVGLIQAYAPWLLHLVQRTVPFSVKPHRLPPSIISDPAISLMVTLNRTRSHDRQPLNAARCSSRTLINRSAHIRHESTRHRTFSIQRRAMIARRDLLQDVLAIILISATKLITLPLHVRSYSWRDQLVGILPELGRQWGIPFNCNNLTILVRDRVIISCFILDKGNSHSRCSVGGKVGDAEVVGGGQP